MAAAQHHTIPTKLDMILFRFKVLCFQARRFAHNLLTDRLKIYPKSDLLAQEQIIAISDTPLWTETHPNEQILLAGKIENLRVALRALHGREVEAGEVFSFWKHVGPPFRIRGFTKGRELREGCIIPSVGGGLCQLSNALYDVALQAGFTIVERHAHSQVIPGSLAEMGRDATVFWNYVDLRFKSDQAFRLECTLTEKTLRVCLRAQRKVASIHSTQDIQLKDVSHIGSCTSCGVVSCSKSIPSPVRASLFGRTAYLVDSLWPEYDAYIKKCSKFKDVIFLPLNGHRWKRGRYTWTTTSFSKVRQAVLVTLWRGWRSRRMSSQGAEKQLELMRQNARLAKAYAKRLKPDMIHLVVAQDLLPYLLEEGYLGGRQVTVLMTRAPYFLLHEQLDAAASRYPESSTLADFRAPARIVEAERQALNQAHHIVMLHPQIQKVFSQKTTLLLWEKKKLPVLRGRGSTEVIFPTVTVGRYGAYELREVVKSLRCGLILGGKVIETSDFWKEIPHRVMQLREDWLKTARVVVWPSYVTFQPRRLLQALAAGVPVITTRHSGLEGMPGVHIVEAGNIQQLHDVLIQILRPQKETLAK